MWSRDRFIVLVPRTFSDLRSQYSLRSFAYNLHSNLPQSPNHITRSSSLDWAIIVDYHWYVTGPRRYQYITSRGGSAETNRSQRGQIVDVEQLRHGRRRHLLSVTAMCSKQG
jgi:hypothetical protein